MTQNNTIVATNDAADVVVTESDGDIQRVFTDLEECKRHRPEEMKSEKCKVFEVTRPDGSVVYAWGFTNQAARNYVAEFDGYTSQAAESKRGRKVDTAAVVNNVFNNADEYTLRAMGVSETFIAAILAARQGNANAAHHVNGADEKRDSKTETPPPKKDKRNKGK